MSERLPFLSFVVCGRNDNHAENFLSRLQLFVDSLSWLCQQHNLESEVIIVEWYPTQDRPSLRDCVNAPRGLSCCPIRIIEVPSGIHSRFENSDKMPIFEFIAKNVGIRRAKGEYIIATNPDIIFSRSLIKFLAKRQLSKGYFYRADRYDVKIEGTTSYDFLQLERFCRDNWFIVHKLRGSCTRSQYRRLQRFKLLRPLWHPRRAFHDLYIGMLDIFRPWRVITKLHYAAAGDFFLMARQNWHDLRGYPQVTTYTASYSYVDVYLCFLAGGVLRQKVLPYAIYHQYHLKQWLQDKPVRTFEDVCTEVMEALKAKNYKPHNFTPNGSDWGMADTCLNEYRIT